MAIPSGTYYIATPQNPTGTVTDFTALIDLSLLVDGSDTIFTDSDIDDGRYMRFSNGAGTVEYASDVYFWDRAGGSGFAAVKIPGAWTSTGSFPVRVYPALTANGAYAASDTYGQYNAYSSAWKCFLPLGNDVEDRTINAYDGINSGATFQHAGELGMSAYFNGASHIDLGPTFIADGDVVFGSINPTIITSQQGVITAWDGGGTTSQFLLGINNSSIFYANRDSSWNVGSGGALTAGTWQQIALTLDASNLEMYTLLNGSVDATRAINYLLTPTTDIHLGDFDDGSSKYTGYLQNVGIRTKDDISVKHFYDSISDNSTFWGTWTRESAGYDPQPSLISGKLTTYSPTVQNGQNIVPSIISAKATLYTPTVTVPGLNVSLISGKAVLHSPTVTNGQNISPTIINGTGAIYAPIIGQRISPDLIRGKLVLHTPFTGGDDVQSIDIALTLQQVTNIALTLINEENINVN